jgi:ribosomal-protein-alanine N-acetyltransferase
VATVATISSSRLDLVSISPEIVDALVEGQRDGAEALLGAALPDAWPQPPDKGFLVLRRDQMRRDPSRQEWLVRALVLRETRELIGTAGFHGPPGVNCTQDRQAVEVGYTVLPPHRRRGYATEAVEALAGFARERGVRKLLASVAPTNEPSLAIVRKLGFVHIGEHWDEQDGLELEFALAI